MDEKTVDKERFKWWLPLYSALGALVIMESAMACGSTIGVVLYILVAAPISLILLVVALRKKGRRRLAVFSMLVAYWAVSGGLVKYSFELHTTTRWLLWSQGYKAKVRAQPGSANGQLRHIEWDGWGFPGAGYTVVYLVFDPNDSLWTATKTKSPGRFSGIPCEVPRVRRLERDYYTVLFYTDSDWEHCD